MRYRAHILSLALCALSLSCSQEDSTMRDGDDVRDLSADDADIGSTGDADTDAEVAACSDDYLDASSHSSYVPSGQCPAAATRLIVMGDSISVGVGAGPGLSYAELLAENDDRAWSDSADWDLRDRLGAIEVLNVAIGGATSQQIPSQLESVSAALDETVEGHSVVVVTIGGNDLIVSFLNPELPLQRLEERLREVDAFFDDAERFPDGVSLYVMNVYEPSDGVGQVESCFGGVDLSELLGVLESWDDAYVALGMELDFAIVDALHHFKGHGFYHEDPTNAHYDAADPTLWFDGDCIHPNERGHHEIRRLFFEAIARDVVAD